MSDVAAVRTAEARWRAAAAAAYARPGYRDGALQRQEAIAWENYLAACSAAGVCWLTGCTEPTGGVHPFCTTHRRGVDTPQPTPYD